MSSFCAPVFEKGSFIETFWFWWFFSAVASDFWLLRTTFAINNFPNLRLLCSCKELEPGTWMVMKIMMIWISPQVLKLNHLMLSQPIHTPHSKDGTGKGFSPYNIDTFFWNGIHKFVHMTNMFLQLQTRISNWHRSSVIACLGVAPSHHSDQGSTHTTSRCTICNQVWRMWGQGWTQGRREKCRGNDGEGDVGWPGICLTMPPSPRPHWRAHLNGMTIQVAIDMVFVGHDS